MEEKITCRKIWLNFKTLFFQAYMKCKEENKYNVGDYSNDNLTNYIRDIVEALQTMLQVNNTIIEE